MNMGRVRRCVPRGDRLRLNRLRPGQQSASMPTSLANLVVDLQARGLRDGAGSTSPRRRRAFGLRHALGRRFPITVPTDNATAAASPYALKAEDDGYAIFDGSQRRLPPRPAAPTLLRPHHRRRHPGTGRSAHLDSFASTVIQTCSYWGNDDQCKFCGIGVSLDSGRTIVKSPEQLAEVAAAAKQLDGAVDATLTTRSSMGSTGALGMSPDADVRSRRRPACRWKFSSSRRGSSRSLMRWPT